MKIKMMLMLMMALGSHNCLNAADGDGDDGDEIGINRDRAVVIRRSRRCGSSCSSSSSKSLIQKTRGASRGRRLHFG